MDEGRKATNSKVLLLKSLRTETASVVQWSEFFATGPEVPGSILHTTFSEKLWVWNGVHSPREYN
jgi:hypothetical protein